MSLEQQGPNLAGQAPQIDLEKIRPLFTEHNFESPYVALSPDEAMELAFYRKLLAGDKYSATINGSPDLNDAQVERYQYLTKKFDEKTNRKSTEITTEPAIDVAKIAPLFEDRDFSQSPLAPELMMEKLFYQMILSANPRAIEINGGQEDLNEQQMKRYQELNSAFNSKVN